MDKYLKIYRFPKNHQFANQTFIQEFEKHVGDGPVDPEPMGGMEEEGPHNQEA